MTDEKPNTILVYRKGAVVECWPLERVTRKKHRRGTRRVVRYMPVAEFQYHGFRTQALIAHEEAREDFAVLISKGKVPWLTSQPTAP
jgi:hypothetical protein